jgi:hypothetical protein
MMVGAFAMVVALVAAVSAALGLERRFDSRQLRAQAAQHLLDHMVGPDAKSMVANLSRQVPVSQVPGQAHELAGILVPDFGDLFRGSLDHQPPAVFELHTISVSHGHSFGKVEKDVLACVQGQADTAAVPRVEIERKGACGALLGPVSSWAMNRSGTHGRLST